MTSYRFFACLTGVLLFYGCSSDAPIGSNNSALGGAGEPPKADGTCNSGLVVCAGTCTDVSHDPRSCGACGSVCAGTCSGGVCSPAGTDAGPADTGTVDDTGTYVDSGPSTETGGDSGPCAPALTECAGACVDVSSDPANCGACGTRCPSGTCIAGACGAIDAGPGTGGLGEPAHADGTCDAGLTNCAGYCRDLTNDKYNCGACASVCSGACTAGVCG